MLAGAGGSSKVHDQIVVENPDNAETQVAVEAEVSEAVLAEQQRTEPEIPPSQPRPEEPNRPKAD